MNILIWGAGKYLPDVIKALRDDCQVLAIVDSNPEKEGERFAEIEIISPARIGLYQYDAILVSPVKSDSIIEYIRKNNLTDKPVIQFWDCQEENLFLKEKNVMLLETVEERNKYKARLDSAPYEWGIYATPQIHKAEECLKKIIEGGYSLCRFGDGEYNIMLNQGNPSFQDYHEALKERLIEVLQTEHTSVLVAIAQNFTGLDQYTESAADEIRLYMEGKKRQDILGMLPKRTYYDAYVSRPYLIYKDKAHAARIYSLFRELFFDRKILMVEGVHGRVGVGNDLFSTARMVRRIVCPDRNAWAHYQEIMNRIGKHTQGDSWLVCISLGPAATVMAYDLAMQGIQALDLGQLDCEYEWMLRGVLSREPITGKSVVELPDSDIIEENPPQSYHLEVVDQI